MTSRKPRKSFTGHPIILFLMEGVIRAFTSGTELAKDGIRHLEYPPFWGKAIVVFKVLGSTGINSSTGSGADKRVGICGLAFNFMFACIAMLRWTD